jgi:hypothetical protein
VPPTSPLQAHLAARWGLAGLAAISLLTTAGCGPSTPSGSASSAPSSAPSPSPREQAMRAYWQCMTQHGVTFPDHHQGGDTAPSTAPNAGAAKREPGTPPPGVNPQTWNAARTACASLTPHRTPNPASSTPSS